MLPDIRLGTLWNVLGSDVDLGFVLIGAGAAAIVTWVNYLGIRTAAIVQTVVTGLIVCAGCYCLPARHSTVKSQMLSPGSHPSKRVLAVLIMVPAMLVGFDVIPQSAEEIGLPANQLGRLLVTGVLRRGRYIFITASVGLALTQQEQAESSMATARGRFGVISPAVPGLVRFWCWVVSAAL